MKIRNKFIVTIIFLTIISIFYCISSQAFTYTNENTQYKTYNFGNLVGIEEGEEPPHYYIDWLNNWQDWTRVYYTTNATDKMLLINETDEYYEFGFFNKEGKRIQCYIWGGRDPDLRGQATCYQNELISNNIQIPKDFKDNTTIAIKGKIYNQDGTIFFPVPPQTLGIIMGTTFKTADMMGTMKIMITGFLKYLIVFVISVVAFWKGWQFLLKHFRKA